MDQLIIFLIILGLGYSFGSINESLHYASIRSREKQFLAMPAVSTKNGGGDVQNVEKALLVMGSAVISIDYFKRFVAGLRNIFGGNVRSYESLVDRARREATLRMKEAAGDAHIIVNTRIETAPIGQAANRRGTVGSVEAIAYGTALTYSAKTLPPKQ